jgi:GNAT superfamily N-acetyltransferase
LKKSYELHVKKDQRGLGIGSFLLKLVEDVGKQNKLPKIMLTAFHEVLKFKKSFISPINFYKRHGFTFDPISPSQCLPAKEAKNYDYEIMSKLLA